MVKIRISHGLGRANYTVEFPIRHLAYSQAGDGNGPGTLPCRDNPCRRQGARFRLCTAAICPRLERRYSTPNKDDNVMGEKGSKDKGKKEKKKAPQKTAKEKKLAKKAK